MCAWAIPDASTEHIPGKWRALLMMAVALLWGITVTADSARFSTCISELSNPTYSGTALTRLAGGLIDAR